MQTRLDRRVATRGAHSERRDASALLLALALLQGCGESRDARRASAREDRVFLLNLEPARIALDGAPGLDLSAPRPRARIAPLSVGFSTRRCLVQARGSEVAFRSVLSPGARVQFEVGFGLDLAASELPPSDGRPFQLELLARSPSGEEALLWSAELVPPESRIPAAWQLVECAVPFAEGDLVFRMPGAPEPRIQRPAPGWGNPRIVLPEPRSLAAERAERSVIVFLVDTLRADRIGPMGHARGTTPALDAVARESILFTQANSTAPWTKASVASLMTSRYPSHHGAEGFPDRLRSSETTLAELFTAAGYNTAAVGFNTWVFNRRFNLGHGFQEIIEVFDQEREGGARADAVVAEAMDWILRRGDKPFLLYIHAIDPHAPYVPAAEDLARFVPEYVGEVTGRLEGPGAHIKKRKAEIGPPDLEYLLGLYDAEIAFADRMLGRLVQSLQELELWDEVTFVFTADHGEEFLEHGNWSHGGSLYQEQLHVPLLLKPRAAARLDPRVRDDPVSLLDVAPTLCELAGVPTDGAPFSGQSLLSYGDGVRRNAPIFGELRKEGQIAYSVRHGDIKFIQVLEPRQREELFDLRSDPGEQQNLIERADPETVEVLRDLLGAHRAAAPVRGLYIEFLGAGESAIEVRIEAPDKLPHDLNESEREGDSIFSSDQARKRTIQVALTLGEGDVVDVIVLDPEPGLSMRVSILVDGEPLDPARIRIGSTQAPAAATPLTLVADAPDLLAQSPPPRPDELPELLCRIWQLRPAEEAVEFDAETLQSLRDLGYVR
jgi:arylsulfatase A-like enzyme